MNQRKRLSVIIALGAIDESLLFSTLNSIHPFRKEGIEVIVVHNCRLSPRIHQERFLDQIDIYIFKDDNGIYDAYNTGAFESSSDWLLFFGQGDIFLEWQKLNQSLASAPPSIGFVCGQFSLSSNPQSYFPATTERFYTLPTSHQAMVTRKSLLVEKPFNLSFKIAADYYHYLGLRNMHPRSTVSIHPYPISIVKTGGYSESNMAILNAEYKRIISKIFGPLQYLYFRLALLSTAKSLRHFTRVRLIIKKVAFCLLLR